MLEAEVYVPISVAILFPSEFRGFSVYVKNGRHFKLFCAPQEPFTAKHRQILTDNGIAQIFVRTKNRNWMRDYAESFLGGILSDDDIPLVQRCEAFYHASMSVARETLATKLPSGLGDDLVEKVKDLVGQALQMLSDAKTLKSISKIMSHDYETYSHCVNVFILSASLLASLGGYSRQELLSVGVGAMLHDIGKALLPTEILNKKGPLSGGEFTLIKEHPLKGAELCRSSKLSEFSREIVLFHHEKLDGSGYPLGLKSPDLPDHVRAVTVVDIYDALTSKRPYAPPMSPFDALNLMRVEFVNKIDPPLFERFVKFLGGLL